MSLSSGAATCRKQVACSEHFATSQLNDQESTAFEMKCQCLYSHTRGSAPVRFARQPLPFLLSMFLSFFPFIFFSSLYGFRYVNTRENGQKQCKHVTRCGCWHVKYGPVCGGCHKLSEHTQALPEPLLGSRVFVHSVIFYVPVHRGFLPSPAQCCQHRRR
jgi:hypothetical protein